MKGVIFLLALCAFQTVLADFRTDLNNKHISSIKEMNDIVKKLHDNIQVAYADGLSNGLNVVLEECWEDYKKLQAENKLRVHMCENCYKIGIEKRDHRVPEKYAMWFAQICYSDNIAAIVKEEEKRRAKTKECIQRHYDAYVPLKEGQKHPAILL